jgi:hypothetical protein
LSLHDILEELENSEDPIPECITFEPPENANANVTDEDSGDENAITIQNLPGSVLRAPAEAIYSHPTSYSSDSENEEESIRLAYLQKRARVEVQEPTPSTSSCTNKDVTLIRQPSVENKTYQWRNQHNSNDFPAFQHLELGGADTRLQVE